MFWPRTSLPLDLFGQGRGLGSGREHAPGDGGHEADGKADDEQVAEGTPEGPLRQGEGTSDRIHGVKRSSAKTTRT